MLKNKTQNITAIEKVRHARSFFAKTRGLMFTWPPHDHALIFDMGFESRAACAMHMLFVFYPIGVIFLDGSKKVVSIKRMVPFQPYCVPDRPARYVIEVPDGVEKKVALGDTLEWEQTHQPLLEKVNE